MEERLGLRSRQKSPPSGGRGAGKETLRELGVIPGQGWKGSSWRERRNPTGVCGQGKERWEPLVLESGDSLPVTASSFSRWDWCGRGGPRTHPGPGKVEGGRVESGLSPDPDRRQWGGARKGLRWGVGCGQHRLLGQTNQRDYCLPSLFKSESQMEGLTPHALHIQLPCPCPSECPHQQGLYLPTPNASPRPASTHPQSVCPALAALRHSLQPQAPMLPGSLLPGLHLVAKGACQAPVNVLSLHTEPSG